MHRKWKLYRTYAPTFADSGAHSKYSVRIAISRTGKYRFRAGMGDSAKYAAAKSLYSRSMRVK